MRAAHTALGGSGRGRRYATQQLNQAYAVMVASQFQGYCRDLHTEAVDHLVSALHPAALGTIVRASLTESRKLDSGNPNAGNLGSDFGRLGVGFWPEVLAADDRSAVRKERLDDLAVWRNAIAHQDFDPAKLGGRTEVWLRHVDRWRSSCNAIAITFDRIVADHVGRLLGARPW